jgi:hypothetical protein
MALIQVGQIIINDGTSYSEFTSGDVVTIYFNNSTNLIEVYNNTELITVGDSLNEFDNSFYWDIQSYPSIYIVDSLITFQYYTYFPYTQWLTVFKPIELVEEVVDEVNDLLISINLITPATGEIIADGSFIVTASGTNTPFLYSITNFTSDSGQSSTTFSGLVPGTYTVIAKDSVGYKSKEAIVLIGYDTESYEIRWWFKEQNRAGVIFLVDILERGYTGGSTEVTGKNPFVLTLRGEGGDIHDQGIIASSASISLVSTIVDQYKAISLADDSKFKINRYINNSTLQWSGFILPSTYEIEIRSLPYTTSFTATDGLADLKSLDFHTEQDWDLGFKTSIKGRISQLDAFRICLSKLGLDQGFRIACNIFDTTHTTTNNSPINQTNINSDIYTKYDVKTRIIDGVLVSVEEPSYSTCEQVLIDILTIYKAILVNWEGYWYIVDQEELLKTTINYVEYNSVGTYVSTGSLNPQISFNTAQSTTRWRWLGTQTATTTSVYRNIIFNLNLKIREKGILKNPVLKIGNTINVLRLVETTNPLGVTGEVGSSLSGFYQETIYQNITEGIALSYLLFNDNIQYSGSDSITLKVKSITNLTYGRRFLTEIPEAQAPPYLNLRWMLKVDYKYSSPYKKVGKLRDGISYSSWYTGETINNHYITNFGSEDSLEITLPFDQVEKKTSTYALRVYIPNLYDYDYEGIGEDDDEKLTSMMDVIRGISTIYLSPGFRIITRYLESNVHKYFYFELQRASIDGDVLESLKPTDFGDNVNYVKWRLIHTREYPRLDGDSMTETIFNDISLIQNPEGFDAPEEIQLTAVLNDKNKIDIERDVNIFDEYQIINNAKNIYSNQTTYTDGTPTSAWIKTGETSAKTLQQHLLNWNTKILKQSRQIVNGSFISDVQVTPLSTLKDSGSSNKIFYIQGLTLNDYTQQYSGEIIEIGSDDTPIISAFTTGFKQNAVE